MRFISEKRSAAARANGARSCGPKTAEGKARSSMNALKHGLTARSVDVLAPDPGEFRALLEIYRAQYKPSGPLEEKLIAEAVSACCRLQRLFEMDFQCFAESRQLGPAFSFAKQIDRCEVPLRRVLYDFVPQLAAVRRPFLVKANAGPPQSAENEPKSA